jgi:hypothetical protein
MTYVSQANPATHPHEPHDSSAQPPFDLKDAVRDRDDRAERDRQHSETRSDHPRDPDRDARAEGDRHHSETRSDHSRGRDGDDRAEGDRHHSKTHDRDRDDRAEGGRRHDETHSRHDHDGDPRGGQLKVDGDTVNTGRYTITASKDDGGKLTIRDNWTGKTDTVWGDPHITTPNGSTDFQHNPVTFRLPDGTQITVNPTNNPGVNFINNVTITKGNDAVTMNGFQGNLQTAAHPGQGYHYDAVTQHGSVLTADHGNIAQLKVLHGPEISGNDVPDIDGYANEFGLRA